MKLYEQCREEISRHDHFNCYNVTLNPLLNELLKCVEALEKIKHPQAKKLKEFLDGQVRKVRT